MTWELDIVAQVVRFMAVYGRLLGFLVLMPFFGTAPVPMNIRVALPAVIAVCIEPSIPPGWGAEANAGMLSLTAIAVIIGRELLLGVSAAFMVRLMLEVWNLAGEFIGIDMGLSFATQVDPAMEQESSLLGVMFSQLFVILMLLAGAHLEILRICAASFESVPVGGFTLDGSLMEVIYSSTGQIFASSFRMALPVFAVIALGHVALGVVARFCQEFEVMMLAFPMQIGLGFIILGVSMPAMTSFGRDLIAECMGVLWQMIGY